MKKVLIKWKIKKENRKSIDDVLFIDRESRDLQNWKIILNMHFSQSSESW